LTAPNSVLDECESTNDLARKLGEQGAPQGTWISARTQTRGRGRLGRQWRSLEGNLFLSIIARPTHDWSWVPLITAVGISRVFPRLRIKWPNDLWLDNAKAGGILCEGVGTRQGSFIVIGIGLNCAVAPEALDQPTASLGADVERARPEVIAAVLAALGELEQSGSEGLAREYSARAVFQPGTPVEWTHGSGTEVGKALGLGKSGELRVITGEGEEKVLLAEDVKVRPSR
jgi:BirA family biotin operon repressor/biotin-[acetyl-CoA-carboxylase] ligase